MDTIKFNLIRFNKIAVTIRVTLFISAIVCGLLQLPFTGRSSYFGIFFLIGFLFYLISRNVLQRYLNYGTIIWDYKTNAFIIQDNLSEIIIPDNTIQKIIFHRSGYKGEEFRPNIQAIGFLISKTGANKIEIHLRNGTIIEYLIMIENESKLKSISSLIQNLNVKNNLSEVVMYNRFEL